MNVNRCRFGAFAEMSHFSWEDSLSLPTTITGAFKGPLHHYLFLTPCRAGGPHVTIWSHLLQLTLRLCIPIQVYFSSYH